MKSNIVGKFLFYTNHIKHSLFILSFVFSVFLVLGLSKADEMNKENLADVQAKRQILIQELDFKIKAFMCAETSWMGALGFSTPTFTKSNVAGKAEWMIDASGKVVEGSQEISGLSTPRLNVRFVKTMQRYNKCAPPLPPSIKAPYLLHYTFVQSNGFKGLDNYRKCQSFKSCPKPLSQGPLSAQSENSSDLSSSTSIFHLKPVLPKEVTKEETVYQSYKSALEECIRPYWKTKADMTTTNVSWRMSPKGEFLEDSFVVLASDSPEALQSVKDTVGLAKSKCFPRLAKLLPSEASASKPVRIEFVFTSLLSKYKNLTPRHLQNINENFVEVLLPDPILVGPPGPVFYR